MPWSVELVTEEFICFVISSDLICSMLFLIALLSKLF